jgi:hypothetical protein
VRRSLVYSAKAGAQFCVVAESLRPRCPLSPEPSVLLRLDTRRELEVDQPFVIPYLDSLILWLVGERASTWLRCVVVVSAPQDLDSSNGAEPVEQITKIVCHLLPSIDLDARMPLARPRSK